MLSHTHKMDSVNPCRRCAHKMPTALGPTLESPSFLSLLLSWGQGAVGSQVPCKAPPSLYGFHQTPLDQTQGKSTTACFPIGRLQSVLLVTSRAKCTPLLWETHPLWAQQTWQGPHGHHCYLSLQSGQEMRGRGHSQCDNRQCLQYQQARGQEQSRVGGKRQEGTSEQLFAFSGVRGFHSGVPQFSLNCYKCP